MMLLVITYVVLAASLCGGLFATDEEMAKTEISGKRLPIFVVLLVGAFWPVMAAGAPAYFLLRWWVARKPDVIAKRLLVEESRCAKKDKLTY